MTAAPYSAARLITRSKREPSASPSSRFAEFRTARPPMCCRPASITGGSVESSTIGTLACVAKRRDELIHVDGAVAADVVDAHVEHVCALADLVAGHATHGVPVGSEHRVAERLRPVRVGALADDEERRVLRDGLRAVQRRQRRLEVGMPNGRREIAAALDDRAHVLGRRAAASADHLHAESVTKRVW